MPFEVFTRERVRTSTPKISINSYGRFNINTGATALLKKNPSVKTVLLLWDKETHRIGIQPAKEGDIRAYPLKAYGAKGRSGTGFSAMTFLNHINYDWSVTRSFAAKPADNNMLVIIIPEEYLTGKPEAQDTNLGSLRRKDRAAKGN